ncbi:MAG TPA: Trm112 family protein [Fimbriimonadaceae bacterium]|nr:Trm112 family protein [Fimbriimonadaceae bacterium]HRJ96786.1 Trm112 family protein [Fimbriimonadaceae bacterium]
MIDPGLLEVLACPRCESRPPLREEGEELVCTVCNYRYRVVDGIPHLLVEEAIPPKEGQSGQGSD